MFRLAILLNPPGPLFKGGTYEGLKPYQNTYGRNEQCWSVSVPPLFKKGGKGGFYTAAHSYQSEHIYDISYKKGKDWKYPCKEVVKEMFIHRDPVSRMILNVGSGLL